jgi:CheY-like chemotaxis protein
LTLEIYWVPRIHPRRKRDCLKRSVRLMVLPPENLVAAAGLLKKLGYAADIVANGLAALEALNSIPYDIVFMDCQMPEMDGYDAARAIRSREQSSRQGSKGPVYIIALTANAMEGDREECLAAGMDDYLSKPIRLQDLQAVLERRKADT